MNILLLRIYCSYFCILILPVLENQGQQYKLICRKLIDKLIDKLIYRKCMIFVYEVGSIYINIKIRELFFNVLLN